jgi:hypothetical protein
LAKAIFKQIIKLTPNGKNKKWGKLFKV